MVMISKHWARAAAAAAVAIALAYAELGAAVAPPPVALPDDQPQADKLAPEHAAADLISDGSRISVKEGDFSLAPPKGWEVYTKLSGLTLLMQVPHTEGMKYQRTIQVASFSGPRFIDEVTAKEYEEVIVRKFSATTSSIEGYRIRNHTTIEMTDGRTGLLFYTEFNLDGVALMQAHILVSSKKRHYLMTYTDVAGHFESDAASQFLTEAWDAMISVQLGSSTPARFEAAVYLAAGCGALVILGLLVAGVRRLRSGREYQEYTDSRELKGMATRAPKTIDEDDEGDQAGEGDPPPARARPTAPPPRAPSGHRPPPGQRPPPPRSAIPAPATAAQKPAKPRPAPPAAAPRQARPAPAPAETSVADEEPFDIDDDLAV